LIEVEGEANYEGLQKIENSALGIPVAGAES
jgi:hypothetical protein